MEKCLCLRGGSDHYGDLGMTASSTFCTTISRNTTTKSPGCLEAYCGAHTSSTKNKTRDRSMTDIELVEANIEKDEKSRQTEWPAALQRVVMGEVKESLIAKRRSSTLKR